MASEWCTPTGSSTICATKLSSAGQWSSPCHGAQGLRREVVLSFPHPPNYSGPSPVPPPCPSGVCTLFLPSGSREPSPEARCDTSSSRVCPMVLCQDYTKMGTPSRHTRPLAPPARSLPAQGAQRHATYQHNKTQSQTGTRHASRPDNHNWTPQTTKADVPADCRLSEHSHPQAQSH